MEKKDDEAAPQAEEEKKDDEDHKLKEKSKVLSSFFNSIEVHSIIVDFRARTSSETSLARKRMK